MKKPRGRANEDQRDGETRLLSMYLTRPAQAPEQEWQGGELTELRAQGDLREDAEEVCDPEDDHENDCAAGLRRSLH